MDTTVVVQHWPFQITVRKGDAEGCIEVEVWHQHTGQIQCLTIRDGEHGLETSMGGRNAG